jgi:putative transposase
VLDKSLEFFIIRSNINGGEATKQMRFKKKKPETVGDVEVASEPEIPQRHFGVLVEVGPSKSVAAKLASFAGTARFVYNWALNRRIVYYEEVIKPAKEEGLIYEPYGYTEQLHEWSTVREAICPWYREISSNVFTQSLLDINQAFNNFFASCTGLRKGPRMGYPQFKTQQAHTDSFRLQNVRVVKNYVILPRIGKVKMKEDPTLRIRGGKILTATISQAPGQRWFISFSVVVELKLEETFEQIVKQKSDQPVLDVVGIDVGVSSGNYIVLSDRKIYQAPKPFYEMSSKLIRQQRAVSRKNNARATVISHHTLRRQNQKRKAAGQPSHYPSKADKKIEQERIKAYRERQLLQAQTEAQERGDKYIPRRWVDLKSNRQKEAEVLVAKTHKQIRDVRSNATHEMTTRVIKGHDVVVIEKITVKNLMQNHQLAKSFADVNLGETRRQFEYKGLWYGTIVIVAPTNFPSTQKCSRCGWIRGKLGIESPYGEKDQKLTLSERTYRCVQCGFEINRDLNAARNLELYGRREMAFRRGESVRPKIANWWQGNLFPINLTVELRQDSVKRKTEILTTLEN